MNKNHINSLDGLKGIGAFIIAFLGIIGILFNMTEHPFLEYLKYAIHMVL